MISKRVVLLLILLFALSSCALSNPAKWRTVEVKKNWPDGYTSWTYKRCAGQNLVWTLFGNDSDGVTPWFKGEPWPYWKWWLRNRFHNWHWHVIGYAWWEEGNPYASWNTDHLEYCFVSGDWDSGGFRHIGVKPREGGWFYWRPYFGIHTNFLSAWVGWGRRGQFKASVKRE